MRVAAGAAIIVLSLALGGCGGEDTSAKPKATPTSVSATPSDDSTDLEVGMDKREEIYLRLVRDDFAQYADKSDEWWLGLGNTICEAVKIDSPIEASLGLVKGLKDNGFTARQAGAMLAYASALCPEKQTALSIQ